MKSFLERLASSVAQPASQARLHPLLGSIYAPENQFPKTGTAPVEDLIVSSPHPSPARVQQAQMPRLEPPAEESQWTEETNERQRPPLLPAETRAESAPSFSAPIERKRSVPLPPMPPFVPLVRTGAVANRAEDRQDLQKRTQNATEKRLSQAEAPPSYLPLVRVAQQPAIQSAPRQLPLQSKTGDPRNARAQAPARFEPISRKPDEIRIHIGRIEVAAVSAPAPRQAAPPARKSLDLSEYLKRGNGRAG